MNASTICTCGLIKQSKAGTAVDEAGITRCNNCGKPTTFADLVKAEPGSGGTSGAHRSGAGSTAGSAPGYRIPPVGKASASQMASGQITGLLIGGLLALLVGVVGSALTWPRLALDDAGQLDSSGSAAGLAIFGLLVGVGEVLVLIAVIAYGVRLGVRAAGLRDVAPTDV